jgi:Arabinose efflux permease
MDNSKINRFNRKLYAPMILGSILNPINSSIIAVALIPIGTAFGVPPSQTAWLVSALYLTTAIGQPVVGKLIDTFGPKPLFLLSTSIVGLGSLIAFFAPNIWWLVAARVLIGFGTCAGYPSSMFLIRMESERTGEKSPSGILSILAIANQSIAVIGPVLGGFLIQFGGWQSAFIINLPLSIACLVLGGLRFPKGGGKREKDLKIDYLGMGLFAVMMISLLLFLMNPQIELIYLLIISVIILAIFSYYELRVAKEPFILLRVLSGNKPLIATYTRTLLNATASYSFIYGFTQWLEEGRGLNPSISGSISIPMFALALLVVSLTGKNPQIFKKLIVGAAALVVAFTLTLFVSDDSSIVFLLIITAIIGIPQGLNNLSNQNALYYQALPEQLASSTGLMRTFQYLGAMIASAANGAFLQNGANTAGLHNLVVFQIVISAGLLILVLFDRSVRRIGTEIKQGT